MDKQIYIGLKKIDARLLPDGAIQIFPKFSTWNDFGHQTNFLIHLPNESDSREIRFAFLDESVDSGSAPSAPDIIKKTLLESKQDYLPTTSFPEFFTMQHDMESYRSLIMKFGVSEGNSILEAISDVVHARYHLPFAPKWVKAHQSRVFNLSFLRNSESIFAYYNASSVLAGVAFENLDAADTVIDLEFSIPGFKNSHHPRFSFDRTSIVPRQIAILIGKNGTGKSQTLYKIADFALNANPSLKGQGGSRPILSKIIAIETPGETHNTFPTAPSEPKIVYERLMPEFSRGAGAGKLTLSELFVQLARAWDRYIGSQSRWDIFCDLVEEVVNVNELAIGSTPDDHSQDFPVLLERLQRGNEQRTLEAMQRLNKRGMLFRKVDENFFPLSSGQVSFIRLAAQLSATIENGSLILIDEPETHLHPNLITQFVVMLNKVLTATGSVAILATHSAYLVREVPRTQVHILRESEGEIQITLPRLKTFGADVGAISEFVFGDDIVNRLVDVMEERIRASPELKKTWLEELGEELSTEAIMHITARLSIGEGA